MVKKKLALSFPRNLATAVFFGMALCGNCQEIGVDAGDPDGKRLRQQAETDLQSGNQNLLYKRMKEAGSLVGHPEQETRARAAAYLLELAQGLKADQEAQFPVWRSSHSSGIIDEIPLIFLRMGMEQLPEEALPVIRWYIENTSRPDRLEFSLPVLKKINGEKADAYLLELVRGDSHFCRWHAINEAKERNLKLDPRLTKEWAQDLHEQIRRQAGKGNPSTGEVFDPAKAVRESPKVREMVESIIAMMRVVPPNHAELVVATGDPIDPRHRFGIFGKDVAYGWVLGRDQDQQTVTIFRFHGWTETYPSAAITPVSPEAAVVHFEKIRAENERRRRNYSPDPWNVLGGRRSATFGPEGINQLLLGCWLYKTERWDLAAHALLAILDTRLEDRFVLAAAHHWLGVVAGHEMLARFAVDVDYAGALEQARLIDQRLPGSMFHRLALDLIEELPQRAGDFTERKLPMREEWQRLRETMPRGDQISFLCRHLSLRGGPHGIVDGIPKRYTFRDPARPDLIDPLKELEKMDLTIADVPTLAPHLAERRHLLSIGANEGRTFRASRNMSTNRSLISRIINGIAEHDLCGRLTETSNLENTHPISAEDVGAEITRIQNWARQQSGGTGNDILLAALESELGKGTPRFHKVSKAAEKLAEAKEKRAVPLVRKYWETEEYFYTQMQLLSVVARIDPVVAAGMAPDLFQSEAFEARAQAAVTASLGPDYQAVRDALTRLIPMETHVHNLDDFHKVVEVLIANKSEPSQELLRKITVFDVETRLQWQSDTRWKVIRTLARGGHAEGLRYYQTLLGMQTPTTDSMFGGMPPMDLGDPEVVSHSIAYEIIHLYAPDDPELLRIKSQAKTIEARIAALQEWIAREIAEIRPVENDPEVEVFQQKFEKGEALSESWQMGEGTIETSPNERRSFLKPADATPIILDLRKLPKHRLVRVQFDLILGGNWHECHKKTGPDLFHCGVPGKRPLIHASFCTTNRGWPGQSFPKDHPLVPDDHANREDGMAGAREHHTLGYKCDAVYSFDLYVPDAEDGLLLVFKSEFGTVDGADPQWFGLDNVRVSVLPEHTNLEPVEVKELYEAHSFESLWKLVRSGPQAVDQVKWQLDTNDPSEPVRQHAISPWKSVWTRRLLELVGTPKAMAQLERILKVEGLTPVESKK